MSVSSLGLDSAWRDNVGQWNTLVEPLVAALESSACHEPRFALIPTVDTQIIPSSGKIQFYFHLVPGSIIWGFWLSAGGVTVQLTDVELDHAFFQEPVSAAFLQTVGSGLGRCPSFTLLPTPHPVVGDGLFLLEAWGDPDTRFYMVLGIGEVTDCPVR